jgi:hypothetical protein
MIDVGFWVRPLEALYFGPPAAQAAGDVHGGRTLFPPPPTTFQGMVRSQLLRGAELRHDLDDWSDAAREERRLLVGDPASLPPDWALAGPLPVDCRRETAMPWVPVPRFVLAGPNGAPRMGRALPLTEHDRCDLNDAPCLVGAPSEDAEGPLEGWIDATALRWALAARGVWRPEAFGEKRPPFVADEARTGLAVDADSGRARDGLLYTLIYVRFEPGTGLAGWLRAPLPAPLRPGALTEGVGRAGRRGRLAEFRPLPPPHPDWTSLLAGEHLPSEVAEGDRFWLTTLTPARLADLRHPAPSLPPGIELRVEAALVGPPVVIGGLSMVGRRSRANELAVPGGSAWLVSLTGGTAADRAVALRALNGRCAIGRDTSFGYGFVLVGLGPDVQRSVP